jgi:hypothetical protein
MGLGPETFGQRDRKHFPFSLAMSWDRRTSAGRCTDTDHHPLTDPVHRLPPLLAPHALPLLRHVLATECFVRWEFQFRRLGVCQCSHPRHERGLRYRPHLERQRDSPKVRRLRPRSDPGLRRSAGGHVLASAPILQCVRNHDIAPIQRGAAAVAPSLQPAVTPRGERRQGAGQGRHPKPEPRPVACFHRRGTTGLGSAHSPRAAFSLLFGFRRTYPPRGSAAAVLWGARLNPGWGRSGRGRPASRPSTCRASAIVRRCAA